MPQVSPEKIFESLLAAASQPLPAFQEPPLNKDDPSHPVTQEERDNLAAMVTSLNQAGREISEMRDAILAAILGQVVPSDFLRVNDKGHLIVTPGTQPLTLADDLRGVLRMSYDDRGGTTLSVSLPQDPMWKLTVAGRRVEIKGRGGQLGAGWGMSQDPSAQGLWRTKETCRDFLFNLSGPRPAYLFDDFHLSPPRISEGEVIPDESTLKAIRNSWKWDYSKGYAEDGQWTPARLGDHGRFRFEDLNRISFQRAYDWIVHQFTRGAPAK